MRPEFLRSIYCESPELCKSVGGCWRAALIDQQLNWVRTRGINPSGLIEAIKKARCDHEQVENLKEQSAAYLKGRKK